VLILSGPGRCPWPAGPDGTAGYGIMWQDMSYWGARAIVAGPGTRAALAGFITDVVRRPPRHAGGVLLWRDLAGR
jgi:hypothetical protein